MKLQTYEEVDRPKDNTNKQTDTYAMHGALNVRAVTQTNALTQGKIGL